MKTETYYLPSGRAVAIHADVSKGADYLRYQLGDGSIVTGSRTVELAAELARTRSQVGAIVDAKAAPTFAGFLASCVADCIES